MLTYLANESRPIMETIGKIDEQIGILCRVGTASSAAGADERPEAGKLRGI